MAQVAVTAGFGLVFDPRSGVFVGDTGLVRLGGGGVMPAELAPLDGSPVRIVRWFDDGAWIGDDHVARHRVGTTWMASAPTDCDPSTDAADLVLLDARASNDAWAILLGGTSPGTQLCHFTGAAWTVTSVPFQIEELVAIDGGLVALDLPAIGALPRVMRATTAGPWTEITMTTLGGVARHLSATPEGALAEVVDIDPFPVLIGSAVTTLAPGVVIGLGGERWSVQTLTGEGEHCDNDSITGARHCLPAIEWVQYVVTRTSPAPTTEVAFVTVNDADVYGRAFAVAPGRLAVVTESALWVTP